MFPRISHSPDEQTSCKVKIKCHTDKKSKKLTE